MIEIPETAVFEMDCRRIQLTTGAKADEITFDKLSLNASSAATLSWLVNHPQGTTLEVQIKVKPE